MQPYEIAGSVLATWPIATAVFAITGLALRWADRKDVDLNDRWGQYWLALMLAFVAYFFIGLAYLWLAVREL